MPYDCVTCGSLQQEYHDGRDGTYCVWDCISIGECQHLNDPAVKGKDGLCYWRGENGHTDGWCLPDPAHEERTEDDPPAPYKPPPGQIGLFDGKVIGAKVVHG